MLKTLTSQTGAAAFEQSKAVGVSWAFAAVDFESVIVKNEIFSTYFFFKIYCEFFEIIIKLGDIYRVYN